MKQNAKKNIKLLLLLILIILFIQLFFLKNSSNSQTINDFLFLKLLGNKTSNISNNQINFNNYEKQYKFNINYKNLDFKSIDLSDTIDRNTLIYDKIAPGTSGSFDILLESNQDLNYKIIFNSINEKPRNLNFSALKDNKLIGKSDTLEKLSEKLDGFISKNKKIDITINWYWNYEGNGEDTDIQDTNDAENIRKYQFNIYTFGEELA